MMKQSGRNLVLLCAMSMSLSACMDGSGGGVVSRFTPPHLAGGNAAASDAGQTEASAQGEKKPGFFAKMKQDFQSSTAKFKRGDGPETVTQAAATGASPKQLSDAQSEMISDLQARRSILPRNSTYDRVASSVLAANSRAAESELRAARLRAEAASKNWLPTLGPQISLSSLGDLVANLVVEATLFDNGRKKAERAFAAADVEVAAAALSIDTNERVFTALKLYVQAERAREKSDRSRRALKDMKHFEYIMSERVKGGVSDVSDLNITRHKLAEIRSNYAAQEEAEATAIAELNAMSVRPVDDLRGLTALKVRSNATSPLSVVKAEAEKNRAVAEATMERAAHLPGLGATGVIGKDSSAGLNVKMDKGFGFGTRDSLRAIEATREGATRKVNQANEDARRRLRKLEVRLAALARQSREAATLTRQAKSNLDLFQAQYEAGQRQVMDVVGVYETFARQEQEEIGLKYDAALARLEIAKEQGLLADGSDI